MALSFDECAVRVRGEHAYSRMEVMAMRTEDVVVQVCEASRIPDVYFREVTFAWRRNRSHPKLFQLMGAPPLLMAYLHYSAIMDTDLDFTVVMHELEDVADVYLPVLLKAQTPSLTGVAATINNADPSFGMFPLRVLRGASGVVHVFDGRVISKSADPGRMAAVAIKAHSRTAEGFNPNLIHIHSAKGVCQLVDAGVLVKGRPEAGARFFNDACGLVDSHTGAALVNKLEMFKDGTLMVRGSHVAMPITCDIPWSHWAAYELFVGYECTYWEQRALYWHRAGL